MTCCITTVTVQACDPHKTRQLKGKLDTLADIVSRRTDEFLLKSRVLHTSCINFGTVVVHRTTHPPEETTTRCQSDKPTVSMPHWGHTGLSPRCPKLCIMATGSVDEGALYKRTSMGTVLQSLVCPVNPMDSIQGQEQCPRATYGVNSKQGGLYRQWTISPYPLYAVKSAAVHECVSRNGAE